jgi:hypothetical protein
MDDDVIDAMKCEHKSMKSMGYSHLKCLDCKKIMKTGIILN